MVMFRGSGWLPGYGEEDWVVQEASSLCEKILKFDNGQVL